MLIHPWVIGELACGNLRDRSRVLELLQGLPAARVASPAEVLRLTEQHQLMGRGIGFVDAQLLASSKLTHCSLWTQDVAWRTWPQHSASAQPDGSQAPLNTAPATPASGWLEALRQPIKRLIAHQGVVVERAH